MKPINELLADQAGVIGRRQLLASGYAPHDIKRLLRRRDLTPIQTGVYVNHTGAPTWIESAWAALLLVSRSLTVDDVALAHWSALRVEEGPGRREVPDLPIHVAVGVARRVHAPQGIVVQRTHHLHDRLHPVRRPPRIRYEEAALDVASDLDPLDALGVLARAVGARRSTAARLLASSKVRAKVSNRAWLEAVLADIDQGTHSVLEHGFVHRVVGPHGLPVPKRQQRELTAIGVVYRDAAYGSVLVELDGRLDHSDLQRRDSDLDRDLQAAATGRRTVRLGWGQVYGRPCQTAEALGRVVGLRTQPCSPQCHV